MDLTTLAANPELTAALIVGVVLPFLVDLVTKQLSTGRFKTLVLTALAFASTALVQLISAGDVTVSGFINGFVATFTTAVVAHKGVLEPSGVTGSGGVIQNVIPGGLGTPVLPEELPDPLVVEAEAVPNVEEPEAVEAPAVEVAEGPFEGDGSEVVTVGDSEVVDAPIEADLVVVDFDGDEVVPVETLPDIGGVDEDFPPLLESDLEEAVGTEVDPGDGR